jgi:hypothetical protein
MPHNAVHGWLVLCLIANGTERVPQVVERSRRPLPSLGPSRSTSISTSNRPNLPQLCPCFVMNNKPASVESFVSVALPSLQSENGCKARGLRVHLPSREAFCPPPSRPSDRATLEGQLHPSRRQRSGRGSAAYREPFWPSGRSHCAGIGGIRSWFLDPLLVGRISPHASPRFNRFRWCHRHPPVSTAGVFLDD